MSDEASGQAGGACWAVVLAAGSGERLGIGRPKAFVPLGGQPLLYWSLRAFARHEAVTDLVVVTPPGWDEMLLKEILAAFSEQMGPDAEKIRGAVTGGAKRQASSRLGVEAVRDLRAEGSCAAENQTGVEPVVLVHDAARPLVPLRMIDDLLERLWAPRAVDAKPVGVIPVVPVADTLKEVAWPDEQLAQRAGVGDRRAWEQVGHGSVARTVSRDRLWQAQTPQGFPFGPLLTVHQEAAAQNYLATDEAGLFEWNGWAIETVPGSTANLKVTYPEDLALLAHAMAERV